jgi:transposase
VYGWSAERHHPGQQVIDVVQVIAQDQELAVSDEQTAEPPQQENKRDAVVGSQTDSTLAQNDSHLAFSASSAIAATAIKRPRVPGQHPGRRRLPAGTEMVTEELTVPEHERVDDNGQPLPIIGYRVTKKWDYRPGAYIERQFRCAIYGRPFSEACDRITAPLPTFLIPRGQMTDAAVIHTVVDKFADHLPLYRQVARAGRSSIQLSRSTLVGHIAAVAEKIAPIVDAIADQVRAADYIHLDDTPVRLLKPGLGHTATARIWVYRSADHTVFRFSTTREGRHPRDFLGDYRGFIIADAYAGHENLYGINKATPIGCWAHVRRKFYDLRLQEPFAWNMTDTIRKLYEIERDLQWCTPTERERIRQQRSQPWITTIFNKLEQAHKTILPASDLGKAIAYARKRWPTLTPFVHNGILPIDNNPAENALRPWAIGRKNWLFLGSEASGERAAIIMTIIENCRRHALDPFTYLLDTFTQLHRGCTDYQALTPQAAAKRRDAETADCAS